MTTAASVAQFMALLSGGGNTTPLRAQKSFPVLNKVPADTTPITSRSPKIDFEALLNSVTPDQRQMILQQGQKLLNNVNDGTITLDNLKTIFPNIMQSNNLNAAFNRNFDANLKIGHEVALNTNSDNPVAALFDYIQSQGNALSKDIVKIELSKNGIPNDVIQKLEGMFSTKELVTILTDPKLKAQFEKVIQDIEIQIKPQTVQTKDTAPVIKTENLDDVVETLSIVISGILQQNRGRLENTITFSPVVDEATDNGIDTLLDVSIDTFVPAQLVPVEQKIQPLQLAIMQSQMNGQELPIQTATPVAGGINPFAQMKDGGQTTPAMNEDSGDVIQSALNRNGSDQSQSQTIQSIADRLNVITQNSNGNNNTSGNIDFSSMMTISADGESLLADGDYLMPFSAGFKTAAQATNPLLVHTQASQPHPATQLVAMSLHKMAIKGANGDITNNFKIRLDPPELGKVDIEMDFIKDSQKIKAVIIVDKPETLGLLQRDMSQLLKSMHDAGFTEMTGQDLSFNLSSDNGGKANDGNGQGDNNLAENLSAANEVGMMDDEVNMQMSVIIDPITGQHSVNMLV